MHRIVFEDWDNKARSMKMELLVVKPRGGFIEIKPWEIEASWMSSFLVFVLYACL